MTDDVDRASEREGELLAEALYQQARRAGLAGKTGASEREGELLAEALYQQARRVAVPGCQLCVACQGAHERMRP